LLSSTMPSASIARQIAVAPEHRAKKEMAAGSEEGKRLLQRCCTQRVDVRLPIQSSCGQALRTRVLADRRM
jgi:hypothetical protein